MAVIDITSDDPQHKFTRTEEDEYGGTIMEEAEDQPSTMWESLTGYTPEEYQDLITKKQESYMAEPFDMSSMMALMAMLSTQYQSMMLSIQEQYAEMEYEAPPEVKLRSPANYALERAKVTQQLKRDIEREESLKITLADTVYTDWSLLEEEEFDILTGGEVKKVGGGG